MNYSVVGMLVLLAIGAFCQNAAFTWVSRSRNGGDVSYHRIASWCSNGIWFFMQILIINTVWTGLTTHEFWKVLLAGLVYIISTTEGSCLMMRILLKTETGKRKVGAV